MLEKKFRFASKEDIDLFCVWKKVRSVSKEDTNLFCVLKKKSDLHLRKIQICFVLIVIADFEVKEKELK